jgi:hypothetical protein
MIATAIAAVELVALVAVGVILLGKSWFTHERANAVQQARAGAHAQAAHHPKPAATKPAAHAKPTPVRPMLVRAKTPIMVLNGNGQSGAAGSEAKILRVLGYPIAAVGNATRSDYGHDIAMYLPGYAREARRLAHDEQIPVVAPLDGLQPSQLRGAKIALIVGS